MKATIRINHDRVMVRLPRPAAKATSELAKSVGLHFKTRFSLEELPVQIFTYRLLTGLLWSLGEPACAAALGKLTDGIQQLTRGSKKDPRVVLVVRGTRGEPPEDSKPTQDRSSATTGLT